MTIAVGSCGISAFDVLRRFSLLFAVFLAISQPATAEVRTWHDSTGKFSVDADLIDVTDGIVRLKKADGSILTVAIERLSEADRKFVVEHVDDAPQMHDPVARDLEGLRGIWCVEESTDDGTDGECKTHYLFSGNRARIIDFENEEPDGSDANVVLRPNESPKEIDFAFGPTQLSVVIRGIYQHRGAQLILCIARPNGHRPEQFSAPKGRGHHLMTLNRATFDMLPVDRLATYAEADHVALLKTTQTEYELDDAGRLVSLRVIGGYPSLIFVLEYMTHLKRLSLGAVSLTDDGLALVVSKMAQLPELTDFDTEDTSMSDARLEVIGKLVNLRSLTLTGRTLTQRGKSELTDDGLVHLKDLVKLEFLGLDFSAVEGPGFDHLKHIASLQELDLHNSKITDAGIPCLLKYPNLRALNLADCDVTARGIASLSGLKHLRSLDLSRIHLDRSACASLGGLTQLESLELSSCRIEDDALEDIVRSTNLKRLNIQANPISDDGLGKLRPLQSLEELICSANRTVDGSGLGHLKALPGLKSLDLRSSGVTGDNLRTIHDMTSLEELKLSGCKVGEVGPEHLAQLPRLKLLWLSNTGLTDRGLARLSSLRQLEELDLQRNELTDKGMAHLASLTNLRVIGLSYMELSDAGAVHLGSLKNLEELYLCFTSVGDKGLEPLHGLRNLKFIRINGNKNMTPEAVARLRRALPRTRIEYAPATDK